MGSYNTAKAFGMFLGFVFIGSSKVCSSNSFLNCEVQFCSELQCDSGSFVEGKDSVRIEPKNRLDIVNTDTLVKIKGDQIGGRMKNSRFIPDPKRSLWLAIVLPGAGQIYNRKYWKIPIFYGGFLGCTYALLWNQQMYKDYSQAYLDIMDDNPETDSYLNMLPLGYDITGKEDRFKTIFKNKKNYYRKYRDLSIFCFIGVYILSVVDAYVDAELSVFDISKDLSVKLGPSVIKETDFGNQKQIVGLQCSLNF